MHKISASLIVTLAFCLPTLVQASVPHASQPVVVKASTPGIVLAKNGADNAAGDNHGGKAGGGSGRGGHDDGANHR